jgi:hypothetical protein
VGKISGCYFNRIKKSAQKRKGGIEFNITQDQLWNLYQEQNGKCIYSGLDIDFGDTKYEQSHGVTTASLDRIDSSGGYISGNIQYIHKDINYMKQVFTVDLFLYYIAKIIQFDRVFNILESYKSDYSMLVKPGQFKGYRDISGTYWGKLRKNAEKHSIAFNLKIEDVWGKYLDQGGLCYWSGMPIKFYPRNQTKEDRVLQTASIDRIDSSIGYYLDNIVICHKNINNLKQDLTTEELLFYCQRIYDNCNLKDTITK